MRRGLGALVSTGKRKALSSWAHYASRRSRALASSAVWELGSDGVTTRCATLGLGRCSAKSESPSSWPRCHRHRQREHGPPQRAVEPTTPRVMCWRCQSPLPTS